MSGNPDKGKLLAAVTSSFASGAMLIIAFERLLQHDYVSAAVQGPVGLLFLAVTILWCRKISKAMS